MYGCLLYFIISSNICGIYLFFQQNPIYIQYLIYIYILRMRKDYFFFEVIF